MNKTDYFPITRSLAYVALAVRDLPAAIEEAQEINGLHLVGRSIEQPITFWVPLADVAAIQEFADVKAMSKVFSLPEK